MTTFNPNWDTDWTATSIDATSITNNDDVTTDDPIDNDNKAATEISVTIEYGTTADEGVKIYVLRDVDGTNYEDTGYDLPWGFSMPYYPSTTCRRLFTIPANSISKFVVKIVNETGDDVTATVLYKQCTIDLN